MLTMHWQACTKNSKALGIGVRTTLTDISLLVEWALCGVLVPRVYLRLQS